MRWVWLSAVISIMIPGPAVAESTVAPSGSNGGLAPEVIPVADWWKSPKVGPALQFIVQEDIRQNQLPQTIALTVEIEAGAYADFSEYLLELGGRYASIGHRPGHTVHGIRVPAAQMPALVQRYDLLRIEAPMSPLARPHNSADDMLSAHQFMADTMGYEQVGNMLLSDGKLARGQGNMAAVIDFNLDPFHPNLFHADGGIYDWVDVNKNGVFSPGYDGIDVDGDGVISDGEVIRLAEFPVVVFEWGGGNNGVVTNADSTFSPYSDYIFLDLNDNGYRDVGNDYGADAYTPGLGEPAFVGDDVNGNGVLDIGEKLFRLGTPKVKAIYDLGRDAVYTPGPGFSEYVDSVVTGKNADDIEFHGTYEATRVAGGHAEIQHMGGIAPGADIIFIDIESESGGSFLAGGDLNSALVWANELGARAFNYAYGDMITQYADGSSLLESTIAELHAQGIPQSASAGNEGDSPRHGIVELPPNSSVEVPIQVGLGQGPYSPDRFYMTLRWRGTANVSISGMISPDGTLVAGAPDTVVEVDGKNVAFNYFGGVSPRGNSLLGRVLADVQGKQLPKGQWTLGIQNASSQAVEVDIWVASQVPWPVVRILDENLHTRAQSLTHPATADGIFTVGACSVLNWYPGAAGPESCPLAGYSSAGPRIDGERQLALVAATDLLAGYPLLKYSGGYLSFGGTSGASPHVTGTNLLVIQRFPDASAETIAEHLINGLAKGPEQGTLPNPVWGDGILNTWSAVFPELEQTEPLRETHLVLDGPEEVLQESTVELSAVVMDDDEEVEIEKLHIMVDHGYDGVFEQGPEDGPVVRIEVPRMTGSWPVRVRAVDGKGNLWSGLWTFEVIEEVPVLPVEPEPEPNTGVGSSSGCQSGPGNVPSHSALFGLCCLVYIGRRIRRYAMD